MGKNNKGLIILLTALVIILTILCLLFATGTIKLKNNKEFENEEGSNNQIDQALLNNLYSTLGINVSDTDFGDCLNYFLSNNDYKSNAKQIFGLYVALNRLYTSHNTDTLCDDYCHRELSCAECNSITKDNADKVIKLYNFDNLELSELPGFDDEYAYRSGIPMGTCHYIVTHDTNSEYTSSNSIKVVDNQVVIDHAFGETDNVNSKTNQIVTYEFKQDADGNYYLEKVTAEK